MKFSSRPASFLLVGLLFALMVRTVGLTMSSSAKRHEQGRWVTHTFEAINRIENVGARMSELRYRERNQALGIDGGNPRPYSEARENVEEALGGLRSFTADNPKQRATIRLVGSEWVRYLGEGRAAFAGPGNETLAKILSADHRGRFERANELVGDMRAEEVRLLGLRQTALRLTLDASDRAVLFSGGVMALSLLGIVGLLVRERVRREAARAAAREAEANVRLEAANALLSKLAATDGLTGLANQRAFRERLESEAEIAARFGRPLSLLLFDVDRFKDYNDSFGHPEGDRALRAVARAIEDYAPAEGFAARHGGEEFALLLVGVAAEEAMRVAERIRRAIEEVQWPLRPLTVSIGVAELGPTSSAIDLVESADRALYGSKAGGRNRATRAEPASSTPQDLPGFVAAAIPANETERLAALEATGLLAPWTDEDFDALAEAVSRVFGTPVGLVTLVGADAQTFKARVGIEIRGTSRDVSFCAHAMLEKQAMVVPNALDDVRFAQNPLVVGDPEIRFYAGAAIRTPAGLPLGALCAIDTVPRTATKEQIRMLEGLAREASRLVDMGARTMANSG